MKNHVSRSCFCLITLSIVGGIQCAYGLGGRGGRGGRGLVEVDACNFLDQEKALG